MIGGKAIVITGASSGIGRAAALALGREKASLFLVARRESRLIELAETLQAGGCAVFYQAVDLSDSSAPGVMIREAVAKLGRIDVLINNAGSGYFGSVENTPEDVTRKLFDLNFLAPLAAMQQVIPIMRKQGSGHIINISSVAGKRGLPMSGVYSATKFALNGVSEAVRVELRGTGILVSVINPASTKSEFFDAGRLGDVSERLAPVGRVQTSEEVAAAIVRCVHAPRPEVYPNKPSSLLAVASAIAPGVMDKILARAFRDRMAQLKRPAES
jgi:short-subunit dehydrogenase